ncbi:hypothetical protein EIB18_05250 [Caulobacter vibrioides]|uniref:Uncharacterized protein n=2 Tax=Caulobacter vibrioides TaxID=155892 RepID=Q9A9K5_CAUVC|nr:hypothetical protein [Caulobacter vibrioides]YP_002516399.1 hypothetical protein CCNA_01026 [Caulobacter vibrioides NA1000]AAK22959.1 hypothetical protein CC_0975 [Caulobacter vibrioides CB15]ACL94491.1 hypothetical protein CCNA_01026 [Caulobacter vibrioides NA1000]AVH77122.1 hypothetical protein CA607_05185 [Caulobacter vibrioides]AZH12170.1 hypothetical protein EIB18_05250 [Caulobacter vibrioides]QXZ53051.1 hypothetical protein KZH45_05110 [Caulobacter vibrioides]
MSWQAKNVTFVLFMPSISFDNAGQIFQNATGTFPQLVQQMAPVGTLAGGAFGGGWINLQVAPGRVQVDVVPPPGFSSDLPTLKDIMGALKLGREFVSKLYEGRVVTRVGCVIDAIKPTLTYEEARADFLNQLPFLTVPDQAKEIVFQLNCPVPARSVGSSDVNRLCRWSSIVMQMVAFDMQGGSPSGITHESHASSLFVDVNTDARSTMPIPSDSMQSVCDELAEIAYDTLTRGYDAIR